MKISIVLLAVLLLSACATKGSFNLALKEPFVASETALIRPATREEKTDKMGNIAVRVLLNPPFGQGAIPVLNSIKSLNNSGITTNISGYNSVRVKPDLYEVDASCFLSPWSMTFSVKISAQANKEYLLECTGITPIQLNLIVIEK